MIEGCLIVLEGVDGAGTTTHTRLLAKNLRERKVPVHATQEPSDGPIGSLLRQTLSGRMVTGGLGQAGGPPSWNAMALMFAADRLDHLDHEIAPNLREGLTVLCDRYDHSSVVYQSIGAGGAADAVAWIKQINRFARRPDLTLVLDVPPEVAAERRKIRRGTDIFDDEEFQRGINALYRGLERFFPEERIVHVDAHRPVEGEPAAPADMDFGDQPDAVADSLAAAERADQATVARQLEGAHRLLLQGRHEPARDALKRIVEGPHAARFRVEALTLIAESYTAQAQISKAREAYERAARIAPNLASGHNALFALARLVERHTKDRAGAMNAYERYLERAPHGAVATQAREALCRLGEDAHCD